MRVGMGYDVHQLVEGRDLILGGVNIPYEKGLLGHSDADVLLHAITDAILGAAALGDIGKHFPDTDPAYHNADSMKECGCDSHCTETKIIKLYSNNERKYQQDPQSRSRSGECQSNDRRTFRIHRRGTRDQCTGSVSAE